MKMKEMFHNIKGMSSHPTYYAGYGASRKNLGEPELEQIFDLIKKHHGEQAAEAMLDMVEDLKGKDMAAMGLMQALYNLEESRYKYVKMDSSLTAQALVEDMTVSPGEYEATPTAVYALKNIMKGTSGEENEVDFTGEAIRKNFLAAHGRIKAEEARYRCDLNGNVYYDDFGGNW